MSYSYTQRKKKPKRLVRAAEIIRKKGVNLRFIREAEEVSDYNAFLLEGKKWLTLSEFKLLKWYIQEAE